MRHFIIVEQREDDIEIVRASDLPKHIIDIALAKVFPSGSEWVKFTNARSFRFTNLKANYYILSYTFILGREQKKWDGTLRAWGLIDKLDAFTSDKGLGGHDPQQLFQNYKSTFANDPMYEFMDHGLAIRLAPKERIKIPFVVKFLNWAGVRVPYVFSFPFTTLSKWTSVESALYHQWHDAMTKPLKKRAKPITFTTFTLSKSEDTKMKGIPAEV
jgi:hypothetical protein